MDEARAAAGAAAEVAARNIVVSELGEPLSFHGQRLVTMLAYWLDVAERREQTIRGQAEEIRRLIAERNMLRTPENFTEALAADHIREQAEAIARLTTDLAGAEATNGLLDEEIARLRAEVRQLTGFRSLP